MGLDIHGRVSKLDYHQGYHALHLVRWLALLSCGFPEKIGDDSSMNIFPMCYVIPQGITGKIISKCLEAAQLSGYWYPNLMIHSDAEGSYTRTGKINPHEDWLRGNSVGLLKELETLKKHIDKKHEESRAYEVFKRLYALVKDEVENGKGHITFS